MEDAYTDSVREVRAKMSVSEQISERLGRAIDELDQSLEAIRAYANEKDLPVYALSSTMGKLGILAAQTRAIQTEIESELPTE